MVKLKWYGQAMWKIETNTTTIIIDPFAEIGYDMPKGLKADVVITSHEHDDHTNISLVEGCYKKIEDLGTYQINDVQLEMIEGGHGSLGNQCLGVVHMSLIKVEGLSILHCSDLQVIPNEKSLDALKDIDVVMVPIGGGYTFDPEKAKEFIDIIKPKITIPMHYKTDKLTIPLDPDAIKKFKSLCPEMENLGSSEMILTKGELTEKYRIINFDYA